MATTISPKHGRGIFLVLLCIAAITTGILWYLLRQPEPLPTPEQRVLANDPRLTFATPYKNVHPEVKYVGDLTCAECHYEEWESFSHHPMGQALAPMSKAKPIEQFHPEAKNPFLVGNRQYGVQQRDGKFWHKEWISDSQGQNSSQIECEAVFAIGSGARARSYAILREGFLFQSPITWYPNESRWDLSPGYENRNQHFNRPISAGCLFCHCNQAYPVAGTVNRYQEPIFQGYVIGCERCHGPGELHVQKYQAGAQATEFDETIVNPAKLEHSLREAVCEQCHVQGEQRVLARGREDFDFRPGLPLHLFLMDFVDAGGEEGEFKFVNSVEQMRASRCYQESQEPKKLGCISCHDSHRFPKPERRVNYYRKRCLQCHTDQSCNLPVATRIRQVPQDSCIDCHMPKNRSEINHTSITNHRIVRKWEKPAVAKQRRTPGPNELVPFHSHLIDPKDEEVPRNLGLAMMAMLDRGLPDPVARSFGQSALPLLDQAVQRDPQDWPVWDKRADALWLLGRQEEALASFETVLATLPKNESTLHGAGNLALAMNRLDLAQTYLERARQINPWNWHYTYGLAMTYYRKQEWPKALQACLQSLRVHPSNHLTRSLLIQIYLGMKDQTKAQTEFETLHQMTNENRRADLQSWYEEQKGRWRK